MSDLINIADIKGEKGTGFEKRGGKGPFECNNCEYFKNDDACTQKVMKAKSKQPRHPNGDVVVAPDDCCEYIDRIGKKEHASKAVKSWKDAAEQRARGKS